MIPNAGIDELASSIRERSGAGDNPYVLFLGDGCARAAGVPSYEHLVHELQQKFGITTTESLTPPQLSRIVQGLFSSRPVPSFYQQLAQLIRARFFPLIVTTSYDAFLEQALAGIGFRPFDFRVSTIGRRVTSSSTGGDKTDYTHILKLREDLARDVAPFSPDSLENMLRSNHPQLRGDLIMVGHEMNAGPVSRWLARPSDRELWWVTPQPPSDRDAFDSWPGHKFELTGDSAKPEVFFPELAQRLAQSMEIPAVF